MAEAASLADQATAQICPPRKPSATSLLRRRPASARASLGGHAVAKGKNPASLQQHLLRQQVDEEQMISSSPAADNAIACPGLPLGTPRSSLIARTAVAIRALRSDDKVKMGSEVPDASSDSGNVAIPAAGAMSDVGGAAPAAVGCRRAPPGESQNPVERSCVGVMPGAVKQKLQLRRPASAGSCGRPAPVLANSAGHEGLRVSGGNFSRCSVLPSIRPVISSRSPEMTNDEPYSDSESSSADMSERQTSTEASLSPRPRVGGFPWGRAGCGAPPPSPSCKRVDDSTALAWACIDARMQA